MSEPLPAGRVRTARVAVTAIFALHGVLFASWTAHIPQIKAHLGLTDGTLGLTLLGAPVGSVTATVLAGLVLARAGSRTVVRVCLVGYCLAGALVGIAASGPQLGAALACWGAFAGVLDVAMNAQGIAVERLRRRPVMSTLHGAWSVGALAGAGIGAAGAALGVPLTPQVLSLGVPLLVAGLLFTRGFVADPPADRNERAGGPRASRALLVLGGIAFAGLVCEGAVADWSSVYLRESLHLDAGTAGLGYAACAAAMVAVRLSGARLQDRLGPGRLLWTLSVLAAAGMAAGLLTGHPVVAIVGFAALGVGVAPVIPVVFSAAGNQPGLAPGTAVATVSAIGWAGFMCGPPVIGFVADRTSQPVALGLLPVLMLLIAAASVRNRAIEQARYDTPAATPDPAPTPASSI
ncbi:MFS transporter [Micromonospora sp. NPDC049559]|uniref:MFS transporter n=1 Tax=Micromonospora sp. NPDC049559 TaxID=3155923 RepID=UPI0034380150